MMQGYDREAFFSTMGVTHPSQFMEETEYRLATEETPDKTPLTLSALPNSDKKRPTRPPLQQQLLQHRYIAMKHNITTKYTQASSTSQALSVPREVFDGWMDDFDKELEKYEQEHGEWASDAEEPPSP